MTDHVSDDLTVEELADALHYANEELETLRIMVDHFNEGHRQADVEIQRLTARRCETCQHTRISLASARRECAFNSGAWEKHESCSRHAPKTEEK